MLRSREFGPQNCKDERKECINEHCSCNTSNFSFRQSHFTREDVLASLFNWREQVSYREGEGDS